MPNLIDLTGKQYNQWTVIERADKDSSGHARWLCRCSCGTIRKVAASNLRNGTSKSCGGCRQVKPFTPRRQATAAPSHMVDKPRPEIHSVEPTYTIGQTVGEYRITGHAEQYKNGKARYVVDCIKCGDRRILSTHWVSQSRCQVCKSKSKIKAGTDNANGEAYVRHPDGSQGKILSKEIVSGEHVSVLFEDGRRLSLAVSSGTNNKP